MSTYRCKGCIPLRLLVRTEKPIDFNDGYARFVHCDYNVKRVVGMSHDVLRENGVDPDESDTLPGLTHGNHLIILQ